MKRAVSASGSGEFGSKAVAEDCARQGDNTLKSKSGKRKAESGKRKATPGVSQTRFTSADSEVGKEKMEET